MTPMEFYSTIPVLFMSAYDDISWVDDFIKQHNHVGSMITRVTLRSDVTPTYQPKPDIELDKMRWLIEYTRIARYLADLKLIHTNYVEWKVYTMRYLFLLGLIHSMITLTRSELVVGLSNAIKPHYDLLRAIAQKSAYQVPPKKQK